MKTISVAELQRKIASALNPAIYDNTPVVITRRGVPAAVIVSMQDYKKLKKLKGIN